MKEQKKNCPIAGKDQSDCYCKWMLAMKGWSIIKISTGKKVNKGDLFSSLYHDHKDILDLFTKPVTEDGDILVADYRLEKRIIPDMNKSESEVLSEKAAECIRKQAVKFMLNHKLSAKDNFIRFTYSELLEVLQKFGKNQVYDQHESINRDIEKSFV